jgi:hypothetical protein
MNAATKNTAWTCPTCRATNVGLACGCHSIARVEISVDDIEIVLPARKARKRA